MSEHEPLGPLLHSFLVDHLITVKGLRPASVRSYRDTVRLLLVFVAADRGCRLTRLEGATRKLPPEEITSNREQYLSRRALANNHSVGNDERP